LQEQETNKFWGMIIDFVFTHQFILLHLYTTRMIPTLTNIDMQSIQFNSKGKKTVHPTRILVLRSHTQRIGLQSSLESKKY